MLESVPNLSELSARDKDSLIVRLFAELNALRAAVGDLQSQVTLLEDENQKLRCENQELRGKLAKNSQNSSKPPAFNPRSREGSDSAKAGGLRHPYRFNPRSREGSDNASTCLFSMWSGNYSAAIGMALWTIFR